MTEIYKTYCYKLRCSKGQHAILDRLVESQRILYNAALQERIEVYKWHDRYEKIHGKLPDGKKGKGRSYFDQTKALTECRAALPDMAAVPVNIQRGTLKRLDRAFTAFFNRIKRGEKPGFPRFRGYGRYNTLEWSEMAGIVIKDGWVVSSKTFGRMKMLMHRPLEGEPKNCRLVRKANGWYVQVVAGTPAPTPVIPKSAVGIDAGLESIMVFSDGTHLSHDRYYRQAEKELRRRQRKLARAKKGSKGRAKARVAVARLHARIANKRNYDAHHLANEAVAKADAIIVEDLNVKGMASSKGNLGKSFADAALRGVMDKIAYKAESAGKQFIKIAPHHTSQDCSQCGHRQKLTLATRTYRCDACGFVTGRDHNAAVNILHKGLDKHNLPKGIALVVVTSSRGGGGKRFKHGVGCVPPKNTHHQRLKASRAGSVSQNGV